MFVTATLNGAQYFGIGDKTAALDAGKKSDLVLLDKNPLEDIRAVRTVNSVVANGNYYDRVALDGMLRTARKTKVRLDSLRVR